MHLLPESPGTRPLTLNIAELASSSPSATEPLANALPWLSVLSLKDASVDVHVRTQATTAAATPRPSNTRLLRGRPDARRGAAGDRWLADMGTFCDDLVTSLVG